jgi:hypothetical protein
MKQNWQEILYQRIFDEETTGLMRRRDSGMDCGIEDIEAVLLSLYELEGADWLGRGEVQSVTLSAQIAAHEQFVAEWKAKAAQGCLA